MNKIVVTFALLFFLCATGLLIMVNVCGANEGAVLGRLYWSKVTVSSATSTVVRWTSYTLCQEVDNRNSNCSPKVFALGLQPILPRTLSDLYSSKYFYLSRVAFSCFFSGVILIFATSVCLILVLFSVDSLWSSALLAAIIGFILVVAGAICQTIAHVLLTNLYRNNGIDASIGVSMIGIMWGSLLSVMLGLFVLAFSKAHFTLKPYPAQQSKEYNNYDIEYNQKQSTIYPQGAPGMLDTSHIPGNSYADQQYPETAISNTTGVPVQNDYTTFDKSYRGESFDNESSDAGKGLPSNPDTFNFSEERHYSR